jgi:putative DNA primase/helicase
MPRLMIDTEQMTRFVEVLFRHADEGTFVSLRAFHDSKEGTWRHPDWPTVRLSGAGLNDLVEGAIGFADQCANAPEEVVFAPPIATFKTANGAAEKDIANGLTLSVECDQAPTRARNKLVSVLDPPTIEMASGGEWIDPETAEAQPKLHLHWRLARPSRTLEEHTVLKEARREAMALIGADASGVPMVHPMRWAGSWHRKGNPRLASIVECNPRVEIDIRTAWELLKQARSERPDPQPEPAPGRDTSELIAAILRAADYHDPIARLAMRFITAGMPDGQTVETLRGIMLAVDVGIRDLKDGILHKDRWVSRYNDIPRAVSSARAKLGQPPPDPIKWAEPAKLLSTQIEPATRFPATFLPGPLSDFACDIADRMQCPLDFIAIPLIISAATVIGKYFRLAPKAKDDWTERPCLWGGVISDSAIKKSPAIKEALIPFRWVLNEFDKRYEREMEDYEETLTRAEYDERCWKEACRKAARAGKEMPEKPAEPSEPQLQRLMTNDTTQEELVELMVENPRGLLLFRDELSGWFASFNQYRPGADRQFFLECHAGGSYYKDRKSGSAHIDELYLNIFGGVQPDIVKKVLAGSDIDGMTARFSLLVWPDRPSGFQYVDRSPDLTARRKAEGVFKRLIELDPEAFFGPNRPGVVRALRFDDEALEIFVEWYTNNQLRLHELHQRGETRAFLAHLGKYPGLFARLAIVHHMIRYVLDETSSPTLVDATTAVAVESFIDQYLEPHARQIYRHLGGDPARQNAQRIGQWLLYNPAITQFTTRDIRHKDWAGLTDQDGVNRALDYLDNVAGWVRCIDAPTTVRGGRPTTRYLVNPLIRRNGA